MRGRSIEKAGEVGGEKQRWIVLRYIVNMY